ncbi:hypothetical protein STENM223S_03444 [Streptomyces tendae]
MAAATPAATARPPWMPSPSWLTEPSIAASRAASSGRPAACTPYGAARIASPSLQACRCWAEMGRGQTTAQVLQRAALAEPGAAEGAFGAVRDPLVPGRLDVRGGERGAVPGGQQAGEDRVLGVVRAGRGVVPSPVMRPHFARISEGFMFSAGAPIASPTAAEQRARGPGGAPGRPRARAPRGWAVDAIRGSPQARPVGRGPLRNCPRCRVRRSLVGRQERHPDEMRGAGARATRPGRETKALVSAAFPCWRGFPARRDWVTSKIGSGSKKRRGRPWTRAPAGPGGPGMAIIETEATLHEAHRDDPPTATSTADGWAPRCSARWTGWCPTSP